MKRAVVTSFGIVPIHFSSDGLRVFLVEQYGAQGTHWGFPKGHPESGERPIDTAVREAREETGLVITKLVEGVSFTQTYSFTYEDTIVDKHVEYFIGYVENPGFARRETEIKNAGWYNFTDGRNRLSFINTKVMFDKVVEYLEEHPDEQL